MYENTGESRQETPHPDVCENTGESRQETPHPDVCENTGESRQETPHPDVYENTGESRQERNHKQLPSHVHVNSCPEIGQRGKRGKECSKFTP